MAPTFEGLPTEVREIILEYCLCVEGDIVPFPTHYEGKGSRPTSDDASLTGEWKEATTIPAVALLGVNQRTCNESLRILFGKNVWRLSYDTTDGKDREQAFWTQHIKLFRHVCTQFTMNDISGRNLREITHDATEVHGYADSDERTTMIHDERIIALMDSWQWKADLLEKMTLKTLVLGLQDLFCPSGCCRIDTMSVRIDVMGQRGPWYLLDEDIESIPDVKEKLKTRVEVKGLSQEIEHKLLMRMWGARCDESKKGLLELAPTVTTV